MYEIRNSNREMEINKKKNTEAFFFSCTQLAMSGNALHLFMFWMENVMKFIIKIHNFLSKNGS